MLNRWEVNQTVYLSFIWWRITVAVLHLQMWGWSDKLVCFTSALHLSEVSEMCLQLSQKFISVLPGLPRLVFSFKFMTDFDFITHFKQILCFWCSFLLIFWQHITICMSLKAENGHVTILKHLIGCLEIPACHWAACNITSLVNQK